MVQNSYDSGRRILTFPAIHPCHTVSPNTLLSSLITLAHSIRKFRSKNFVTQKRNAREAIRQVEILVIFLEEIKFNNPVVPQSIVLCFFELHIAFQKIRYLLEDCTCEGSRLWILMKSKRVTIEFQGLMRSIATALDVVPFGSLVLSVEVEEMVLLLARQAQKWKTEVDPDDVRVRFLVVSVLNQFEYGNHPNPIDLKCVLEYLEIGSWSLCNKEIKFLEEEIEFEGEEREVAFASSLVGFMSYCRVVTFDVVDGHGNGEEVDGRQDKGILNCLNPEDFRCPISLEVMKDPVTLSTGQTYDRASILKWFKAGNLSCPKTGEKLAAKDFVPNLLLQKLIWRYCSNYGIQIAEMGARSRDITRTIRPGSPSAAEAMRLISEFLASRLIVGTCVDRNKAAYEIRSFAKSNLFNRSCLLKAGTIPLLLNLLSSMDSLIQENSMAALLNLSKHSKSKSVIVENGGLILILDVLKEGLSLESRQLAAATLFYISSVEEYRKLIGEMPGAIPALVELARDGNPRGKKNSVVALYGLLILPENHQRVLESGAVPVIVDLLRGSERSDLITDSLAVLSALAEKPDGVNSILCTSALHLLVGILHSTSSRITKEYCVSILLSVCINGGVEVVSSLQKSSSLMTSLYSLLTDGTSRASKKASSIINILLGLNSPNSSSLPTPVVRQERFVHVR